MDTLNQADLQNNETYKRVGYLIEEMGEEEFDQMKTKNGLGSIYFNSARNCYQAAFYIVENGEKKRKILSAPTQEEALYKLATFKSAQLAFVREEDIPTPKVYHTVSEVWDKVMFIKKAKCRSGTIEWYSNIVKPILTEFGNTKVEDLTSDTIQKFIYDLVYLDNGKEASHSKVKNTIMQFRKIMTYAHCEGYIPRNPFVKGGNLEITDGVKRDTRENAFTKEEVVILFDYLKNEPHYMVRAVTCCLLLTGMRINELLALRYSDLDRANKLVSIHASVAGKKGSLVISSTKTKAGERFIPVPDIFFDIIDSWRKYVYQDDKRIQAAKSKGYEDIIFIWNDGDLTEDDSIRRKLDVVLKEAGIKKPNTTFHGLRHTYATLVRWAGTSDEIISKLLGHEMINAKNKSNKGSVTTGIYIKENKGQTLKDKKKAVNKYMAYMGSIFKDFADVALT